MRKLKHPVYLQLFTVVIFISLLLYLSLSVILPQALLPVYEQEIGYYVSQPLKIASPDTKTNGFEEIAYIFIDNDGTVIASDNLVNIIDASPTEFLPQINKLGFNKFRFRGKIYYFAKEISDDYIKIALIDDSLIKTMKDDVWSKLYPLMITVTFVVLIFISWWARILVVKISRLKDKIDNLDNEDCLTMYQFDADDEFKALSDAINDMHYTLKEQEEYRNQLYQSISHDFKTPISVIKSYIEAAYDGVESENKALNVIEEQTNKLESKVFSLLYLNKIKYIRDTKTYQEKEVDVSEVVKESIEKFKYKNKNITWELKIETDTIFHGTYDMWEAIVDNMFNNFLRYAETKIKVSFVGNKIIFYNDGPKIETDVLHDIFAPYKKGVKGQFGLGLSIIKQSVALFGYDIYIKNERRGVSFIIK